MDMSNTLKLIFTATLSLFLFGCASPAAKTNMRIIDAHLHTNFSNKIYELSGIEYSKQSLFKEMKANNVVGAVSMTKSYFDGQFDTTSSEPVVIHCAGVPDKVNLAAIEKGLKEAKFKCIKIYLGYVRQYANSPAYKSVYRLAAKYKVPVVFHTGDPNDIDAHIKYADPLTIDEVAVEFRNVNFVLAHLGNPWVDTAAELAYKNPNVYVDISAFLVGDFAKITQARRDEYITKPIAWAFTFIENPSKMLYGTDWPLTPMGPYIEAVKKAIPKEYWNQVFYQNAVDLFKLQIPPAQP